MEVRKRNVLSAEGEVDISGSREIVLNHRTFCQRYFRLSLSFLALGAFCFFLWVYPSPVSPVVFRYANESAPDFVGPLAVNDLLKHGQRLFENEIIGPEAMALDKEGNVYTGLSDGRIIKISKDLKSYSTVLRTGADIESCGGDLEEAESLCGRPLGMVFSKMDDSVLFVADSSLGLLKVNVDTGTLETLLSKKNCPIPINFFNDLVELWNGTLLITDSSLKFDRRDNVNEGLECGCNGQLLAYEPSDGSVRVVLRDLFFPNGVCLAHDGESVLFVETTRARVRRYYFRGSKAGNVKIFSENLPSLPDNISPSLSGGYWVGNAFIRTSLLTFFSDKLVFFRSLIAKFHLLPLIMKTLPTHGLVLELDNEGHVIRSLHDKGGLVVSTASHILELRKGELLIGSFEDRYLVRLQL